MSFNETSLTPAELLSYTLIKSISQLRDVMEEKLQLFETKDLAIYIITYKIYEETADFKEKINDIKNDRENLLSVLDNISNNSLLLNDLDTKITKLEDDLASRICDMNQEKIKLQTTVEHIIQDLDRGLEKMKSEIAKLDREMEIELAIATGSQISLLQDNYVKVFDSLKSDALKYEKLQLNSWKSGSSEQVLGEMLEKHGLRFTASGKLFTSDGSRITFHTAEDRHLFASLGENVNKVVNFVRSKEVHSISSKSTSESSFDSFTSTQDVKYLKTVVGKPLTLALAEIVSKHPSDPIHYLGHYLFKYRYNQEIEQIQKDEVDELTKERKKLAQERWHEFIEQEAKNAVISMVIRAEEMIYQNELKRIEQEMLEAEHEEEEHDLLLQEEAKDKFE